jgi:hypothetical protein
VSVCVAGPLLGLCGWDRKSAEGQCEGWFGVGPFLVKRCLFTGLTSNGEATPLFIIAAILKKMKKKKADVLNLRK